MKNQLIIVVLLWFLWGCNPIRENTNDVLPTINIDNAHTDKDGDLGKYLKKIDFVRLKTSDNYYVQEVNKVIEINNQFLVFDHYSNKLSLFNEDGQWIRFYGKQGQGPNEYLQIMDFTVDIAKEQIHVFDDMLRKIIIYNLEGKVIQEKKFFLYFSDVVFDINTNGYIHYAFGFDNIHLSKKQFVSILKVRENGDVIYTGKPFPDHALSFNGNRILKNLQQTTGGTTNLAEAFNDTIYSVKMKRIEPSFLINFKANTPPKDFATDAKTIDKLTEARIRNYPYLYSFFTETRRNCILTYSYKDLLHLVIFDKASQKTVLNTKNLTYQNYPIPFPTQWTGEHLIGTVVSQDVLYYQKVSPYLKNLKALQGTKESDNPVLAIYHFKE